MDSRGEAADFNPWILRFRDIEWRSGSRHDATYRRGMSVFITAAVIAGNGGGRASCDGCAAGWGADFGGRNTLAIKLLAKIQSYGILLHSSKRYPSGRYPKLGDRSVSGPVAGARSRTPGSNARSKQGQRGCVPGFGPTGMQKPYRAQSSRIRAERSKTHFWVFQKRTEPFWYSLRLISVRRDVKCSLQNDKEATEVLGSSEFE